MNIGVVGLAGLVLAIGIAAWSRRQVEQVKDSGFAPPAAGGSQSDIERLVDAGQTIAAIKLYRQLNHVDLKTAKDAVDKLARERQPEVRKVG